MELIENKLKIKLTSTQAVAKLNVKLSAYTKGIIPDVSEFIKDAPKDGNVYFRGDGEWIDAIKRLKQDLPGSELVLPENSGLIKTIINEDTYTLAIRQWIGQAKDLNELEEDTTYYIYDNSPNFYLIAGTAYSDEEELYDKTFYGGNAYTQKYKIEITPMTSEGEF